MDLELEEEVVIVFGAARGIGFATAQRFEREGATCCWADRDEGIVKVAAEHSIHPNEFSAHIDATDLDAVSKFVANVFEIHGRIDHVVSAIGVGSGRYGEPFWNLPTDVWETVIRGNLMTAVNIAHAVGPLMSKRRKGTLAFLSSVAGQIGSTTDPPYSASKAALISFVQCAARDLAPHGVRVNAFSPGMVKTQLNQDVWRAWRDSAATNDLSYEDWAEQKLRRVAPMARWQTADEVASTIAFIASRHAANITGQTINIDGGQVMHS